MQQRHRRRHQRRGRKISAPMLSRIKCPPFWVQSTGLLRSETGVILDPGLVVETIMEQNVEIIMEQNVHRVHKPAEPVKHIRHS